MHHLCLLAASTACLLSFPLRAAEPITLLAEVRVEIDPVGQLVHAEPAQDLSPEIRAYIEKEVAKWSFKRNDANPTENASTWLFVQACGVPAQAGYTMGLSYYGHGARVRGGWEVPPDLAGALVRSGRRGTIHVHYIVNTNGSATVESIEGLSGNMPVRKSVERWIENLRYDPESLGGKPVATRETVPISIFTGSKRSRKEDLIAQAVESPACKQAGVAAAGVQAIAVDSRIGVMPSI